MRLSDSGKNFQISQNLSGFNYHPHVYNVQLVHTYFNDKIAVVGILVYRHINIKVQSFAMPCNSQCIRFIHPALSDDWYTRNIQNSSQKKKKKIQERHHCLTRRADYKEQMIGNLQTINHRPHTELSFVFYISLMFMLECSMFIVCIIIRIHKQKPYFVWIFFFH